MINNNDDILLIYSQFLENAFILKVFWLTTDLKSLSG